MKKRLFYALCAVGVFLFSVQTHAYEKTVGNYKLNINESSGKVNIYQGSTLIIKDSQLAFSVNSSNYTLSSGTVTESTINDALGSGTKVVFKGTVNSWSVEQNFYLYASRNYMATDFTVETSSGTVASNYMAPIKTSSAVNFLPSSENRVLRVPFDNDDFIRYESNNFSKGNNTSYEVTVLYNESARQGLIIGSIEHDTWKTGVKTNTSGTNNINSIEIYGGIADYQTRDHISHGKVNLKKIKSPKITVGYYTDWRDGLEDYGKANRLITPKYYNWTNSWNGKKPFGWNSWAALESNVNYNNSNQTSEWIANNIQNRGFISEDNTVYIGLDSYWNESGFSNSTLKQFVDNCHARGQKAGVYLVPFSHWGSDAPSYALKAGGQARKLDGGWCIDPTHPSSKSRAENEFLNRIKNAGFDYIKVDFLSHGSMEADSWYDSNVQTGIQAYNHGMKWLADWFKNNMPNMYVNLSIAPLFPGQYAHSRRISCDAWNQMYSSDTRAGTTEYVLNALTYGWWLDYVYDYNDADHILMNGVSEGENRARITSAVITGIFILGDDYSNSGNSSIKDRSKNLLTRRELNRVARQTKSFRPVYSGSGNRASNMFMTKVADTTYVAVFNYADGQSTSIDFGKLGLTSGQEYNVRDLWRDGSTVKRSATWTESVPSKDVKLLKIFKGDPEAGLEGDYVDPTNPDNPDNPGNSNKLNTRIEAEGDNVTRYAPAPSSGDLQIESDANASGGAFVSGIWNGHLMSFKITVTTAGTYDLYIRYVGQDGRHANVVVNGADQDYNFEQTSSWDFSDAKTKIIPVTLNAGENTIGFRGPQSIGNTWAVNVDYFMVVGEDGSDPDPDPKPGELVLIGSRIEAEGSDVNRYAGGDPGPGDLKIESSGDEVAGASGGAFVSGIWKGHLMSFKVNVETAGTYELHIRYVGQDGRHGNVLVNGIDQDYNFEQTSSWNFTDAKTKIITITLNAGENTIGFRGPQNIGNEWAVNVDYFEVYGRTAPTSLQNTYGENVSVVIIANGIEIITTVSEPYQVLNLQGQIAAKGVASGKELIYLPQGIYIVKMGDTVTKVVIK